MQNIRCGNVVCAHPVVSPGRLVMVWRDSAGIYFLFSDGPSGKPNAEPTTSSKHKDQKVILTCNNPNDDGNPNAV